MNLFNFDEDDEFEEFIFTENPILDKVLKVLAVIGIMVLIVIAIFSDFPH